MRPTPVACEVAEEQAVELALGSLGAEERANLLGHLTSCASCRLMSEELAGLVDGLLLLAPEAEPPLGFEARTLATMTTPAPTPRRWSRTGWLAAAALVAVFAAGALAGVEARPLHRSSELALSRQAGTMRSAQLVGRSGATWGHAYVHTGSAPFVFVSMRWHTPDNTFTVELSGPGIPTVRIDGLDMVNGEGSLGRSVDGDLRRVRTVRVVDPSGRELCHAELAAA